MHSITADITSSSACESLVQETVSHFGRLDILVNNAGIMDVFDPAGSCEISRWDKVIAINLTAPFVLTKLAVNEFLKDGKGGSILNVGSAAALRGGFAGVAYTTSKHGLVGLTKNTAAHYAKRGIRCNIILPGAMETNIAYVMKDGVNQEGMGLCQKLGEMNPGYVSTEELAKLVAFINSDVAGYLNGAEISADRGWTAI